MKSVMRRFRIPLRTLVAFLSLDLLPMLICCVDMVFDHNYAVDCAFLMVVSAANMVLLGHVRLTRFGRKNPSVPVPSLTLPERKTAVAVRLFLAVLYILVLILGSGRPSAFWMMAVTVTCELLTVHAEQMVRIRRLSDALMTEVGEGCPDFRVEKGG